MFDRSKTGTGRTPAVATGVAGVAGMIGVVGVTCGLGGCAIDPGDPDGAPGAKAPGTVAVVEPIAVDDTVRLGPGERVREPDTPPLDPSRYAPMPVPVSVDVPGGDGDVEREPSPAGLVVTYDLRDGTETYRDPGPGRPAGPEQHVLGASGGGVPRVAADTGGPDDQDDDLAGKNFGGLTQVADTTAGLYPRSVKVFFDKGGGSFVCSGSLIDAAHVITAGHCVHEGGGGAWATNVRVIPAYDDGARPYGLADGVQLHSWTGWTQDRDFDHDIGIIDLDRPVGALTGWFGYGYHDDCDYFQGGTWIQSGYPAESPYDGSDMFTHSGDFDSCDSFLGVWYGNEVTFDRPSYGGSSGTGAHRAGIVRAVLSNSGDDHTDAIRLTDAKFGHIQGMIAEDLPATFDLVPLNVVGPATASRGGPLSGLSYLVHNRSSAGVSATYTVRVYLSTNQYISTSDTLIQTHSFTWSFGAQSSVRVNVTTPPTIPAGVSAGAYYVGVLVDVTDAASSNNNTEGWDSSRVVVD